MAPESVKSLYQRRRTRGTAGESARRMRRVHPLLRVARRRFLSEAGGTSTVNLRAADASGGLNESEVVAPVTDTAVALLR